MSPSRSHASSVHTHRPNRSRSRSRSPSPSLSPSPSPSPTPSLPSCYTSSLNQTSLRQKLLDLDNGADLAQSHRRLMSENTRNCVVDFGREHAFCAFDLDGRDFGVWLENTPDTSMDARWVNIWQPEQQKDIIKTLTKHYGISMRLREMMSSDPSATEKFTPISPRLTSNRPSMQAERHEKLSVPDVSELESGHGRALNTNAPVELDKSGLSAITFSQIVNQIWHFVSVDYGPRYMCIGYNSLYAIPDVDFENEGSHPDGKRVWAWLILCDDNTVISIQENPFPHPEKFDTRDRLNSIKVIRRNVNLVFSGLSALNDVGKNPLMTTQIRNFLETSSVKPGESPSLLFYYLFDDWISSYSLVIKKEHSYSTALEDLRQAMLERAQVGLIDELHRLGRHLQVLKRLYQSYELILNRILKRQRLLREEKRIGGQSMGSSRMRTLTRDQGRRTDSWATIGYDEDPSALGGIELASSAASRFERLLDRIGLYALCEIEECITEKEALTFLVFNLIAMKDSQAVEKLTRITILLAKVTILFLPVSLSTAYFSTEVKDLQNYTAKTYWVTFTVVMSLSAILLVLFGWFSGTMEGRPIYRSIVRTLYDTSRAAMGRRKRRGGHTE